jgi:transcription termination factor Rho
MFTENKRKKYERLLGLDDNELKSFLKRYSYYLKGQDELSPNAILNGFFILANIRDEKDKTEALKAKYKSKNKYIIKYRDEIIELYKNGFGYVRISKQLDVNHKVKVSKSSIERFIKNNGIKRDG